MKRATKAVMTAAALPFAAALPLTFGAGTLPAAAAAASSASSLIPSGPATVLHHGPTPWEMDENLGGALCDAPKVCREVAYGWIQPYGPIEIGMTENVNRLDWAIHYVGTGPKIVYGFSGGARVASVWLRDHADDADAPDPDQLSVVLIGNGGRKYGGVNGWFWGDLLLTPTDTQYDVVDIAREYDPIADFPSNPFNLLALANGLAAFSYVHLRYDEVDLDDPDNVVWKEGKTTYVYVPTEHLPLLQGFYDAGLGSLVEGIEPRLREIIDKAYNRTWLEGKPTQGEQNAAPRSLVRAAVAEDKDANTSGTDDAADTAKDDDTAAPRDHTTHPGATAPEAADDAEAGDTDADDATDSETKPDTEAEPDSETKPDTEAEPDTETEPETKADTDTGATDEATPTVGKHRAPLHGTKKSDTTESATSAKADTTTSTRSTTSAASSANTGSDSGSDGSGAS
ncbi:MAG: PE-PPE domain-containing protein [Mycolicibacterium rufum]|nr:PE-PPE domain-containing protein [Mycolicibacterium rufum]